MTNAFGVSQSHYRFAEEDGTEATSTLLGSEDTALSRLVAANSNIQLRILTNEVGNGSIAGTTNATWQLQRSINGGAFANVTTTSTGAKVNTASALTDGGTTTNRLTAIGTFSAGQQDDQNGAVTYTHPANNCTEHAFGITLVAAELAEGDVVTFKLLYQAGEFTATQNGLYNVTPTLNITKSTQTLHDRPVEDGLFLIDAVVRGVDRNLADGALIPDERTSQVERVVEDTPPVADERTSNIGRVPEDPLALRDLTSTEFEPGEGLALGRTRRQMIYGILIGPRQ